MYPNPARTPQEISIEGSVVSSIGSYLVWALIFDWIVYPDYIRRRE